MANRNFASGGKMYSMHVMPVLIDCNFEVQNADGDGQIELKGPLVEAVYMHVSASPSANNPNPAAGTIVVQLQDNFNKCYSVKASIQSPSSGSDLKIDNAALTAGVAYTITILGDASRADWTDVGVPPGVTPAVGVSFIAASTGIAGNTLTSRVQATAAAGSAIATIEAVPSLQMDLAPDRLLQPDFGAQLILQCRDYAGAIAAPANGSRIFLEIYLSNSSITIAGE